MAKTVRVKSYPRRAPYARDSFVRRRSRSQWYRDGFGEGADAAQVNVEIDREEMLQALEDDNLGELAGQVREHGVQMAGDISYDVDRPGGPTSAQYERWEEGFYAGFEAQARKILGRKR